MKFITRDTDYALRALLFMATLSMRKDKKIVTVDEIADGQGLPKRFLRRILQRLAKNKILSSYKGQDGGFSFLKNPSEIGFVDILEIFQGGIDFTNCQLRGKDCLDIYDCPLRRRLRDVNLLVTDKLKEITIASLLMDTKYDKKKNHKDRRG